MPKDTKFNQAWLDKTDSEGVKLNKWLKERGKKSTFQCILCKTEDLDCSNQGWGAIHQHMKTKGHLENIKILKNNSTFFFESPRTPSSTDNFFPIPQLRLGSFKRPITLNFQEKVTKAEAIWALTVRYSTWL